MAIQELEATPSRTRRRPVIIGALALVVVAVVVAIAPRAYFRTDLFDDYRAGYAAVEPSAAEGGGINLSACERAVAAAYPAGTPTAFASDQAEAFFTGCSMKRFGHPLTSVWQLHWYIGDED